MGQLTDFLLLNLRSYDLVNRYSQGQKAYHHSYLEGMTATIDEMAQLGIKKNKMNAGFA